MSKQPLFSVGEEVILCSEHYPEYSGDGYTINQVVIKGEYFRCRLTGNLYRGSGNGTNFAYTLNPPRQTIEGREGFWAETSLRKKYPPSTESFKEMMSRLTKVTMYNQQ